MRLTLRTMLAYLDDVLDPEDSQDMARRIADSEFATNVVNRTRDVLRRLRLAAPTLSGRGMGVDPNTVAEYLDNTLPGERVPDFEKVCLESDVHLAEVASCHQILTLLLGEPAEVDPASREKMYGLISRGPAVTASTGTQAVPAIAENGASATGKSATEAAPTRHKPEVPDYLRNAARAGRMWRAAAAILFLLVLGAAGVAALKPEWLPLALRPGSTPKTIVAASGGDAGANLPGVEGQDEVEAVIPKSKAARPKDKGRAIDVDVVVPENASDDGHDEKDVSNADGPPEAEGENLSTAIGENPDTPATPSDTAEPIDDPAGDAPGDPIAAVAGPEGIGRFLSDNKVLLRQDAKTGRWQRLPRQATLFSGDRLLSLPTYRSTLALADGLTVQLLGETALEIVPPDEGDDMELYLNHGRAVLMTVAKGQIRVRLHAGDRTGTLTFGDSGSGAAIDVHWRRAEGADPEASQPAAVVDLYATSGKIVWDDGGTGKQVVIEAPAGRSLGQPAVELPQGAEAPTWFASDNLSAIDEKASEEVERQLRATERSVEWNLQELAGHRRVEVRALAVRCLAATDEYAPLLSALADPSQKSAWHDQVESLRRAVARGPESAAIVRKAIETQRGADGKALYRMLWGYTDADLKREEGDRLVEYLDHEDLDYRVLAFWNLQELTGLSMFYRPEYSEQKRKQYLQKWKQKAETGQITIKAPAEAKP